MIALVLVLQSLAGIGAPWCAAMSGGALNEGAAASRPLACSCCSSDAGTASATCAPREMARACCCGEPLPEQPQTPPGDSKNKVLEHLLACLPAAAWGVRIEPEPAVEVSRLAEAAAHLPANSLQSLLCVWVM